MAEVGEAGDAVAWIDNTPGHDRVEMGQIWRDVDGDAVQRHPALQPHTDGGDLVFKAHPLVRPAHPDADPVLPPSAPDREGRQGTDDPSLQPSHEGPNVWPPLLQVQH